MSKVFICSFNLKHGGGYLLKQAEVVELDYKHCAWPTTELCKLCTCKQSVTDWTQLHNITILQDCKLKSSIFSSPSCRSPIWDHLKEEEAQRQGPFVFFSKRAGIDLFLECKAPLLDPQINVLGRRSWFLAAGVCEWHQFPVEASCRETITVESLQSDAAWLPDGTCSAVAYTCWRVVLTPSPWTPPLRELLITSQARLHPVNNFVSKAEAPHLNSFLLLKCKMLFLESHVLHQLEEAESCDSPSE